MAAKTASSALSGRMVLVKEYLTKYGPKSDDQIEVAFDCVCGSYRKARTELTRKGYVVQAGYGVNSRGNRVKLWNIYNT